MRREIVSDDNGELVRDETGELVSDETGELVRAESLSAGLQVAFCKGIAT